MKTLLLVEDEKLIRQGIRSMIERSGVDIEEIIECNNGEKALEVLKEQPVDVMFTDIRMPKMDGITFVMKLREKYDFPVIMLSAKSEEVDKIMGLNIGADDYVTKPFRPLELLARVNSHLRRYSRFLNMVKHEYLAHVWFVLV